MPFRITFILAILLLPFSSCQQEGYPRPLLQKDIILPSDAFGPASLTTPWLGHSTEVVVHYGQSARALNQKYPSPRYHAVPVKGALFHAIQAARQLPDGSSEKARVRATIATLRTFERDWRTSIESVPSLTGRGSLRRMAITH
jgi:hypothetical protein